MERHLKALQILKEGTVIPAIPLALTENRKLDERHQRALIRYYLASGVGGLAVAVHTTQFAIRDPKVGLFEPVLRLAAEEIEQYEQIHGKTIVKISGVCGPAEQAVAEASLAKKLGYDAVLLSPGGLSDLSEAELLERTRAVAQVMPVIGFYLQQAVGGRRFTYDYWEKLCAIDGVVAVKGASFNRYQTLDLVRAAATSERAKEIALYTGNDDNLLVDLLTPYRFEIDGKVYETHFYGGLLGHWAVWTHKAVELFDQVRQVRGQAAVPAVLLTLASQITDANAAVFDVAHDFRGCIAGVHEILRRQGLMQGIWCLDEKETLSPGQKEEIDRVYKMYPHLNDDAFVAAHIAEWLAD